MTTDRYTRIVLTVIAGCLVYLCVRDGAPPVLAQSDPQQRPFEVVLVGIDTQTYRFDRRVRFDNLPVKINELRTDYNPLNVVVTNTVPIPVRNGY